MTDPAVIAGTYSDLRLVKGRKVWQAIVEIPAEQGDAFVKAFGLPNSESPIWVAIARLDAAVAQRTEQGISNPEVGGSSPPGRATTEGERIRTRAVMLCKDPEFWEWSHNYFEKQAGRRCEVWNVLDAAAVVRAICNITSRSDLATDTEAQKKFLVMETEFKQWANRMASPRR